MLAGLAQGDKVVASGQFLIDSEASLSGVQARPLNATPPKATAPAVFQGVGRIEQLAGDKVTLSHEPIPAAQWPAMTMAFRLADPRLAREVKVGDRVAFGFEQTPSGPVVRSLRRMGGQ